MVRPTGRWSSKDVGAYLDGIVFVLVLLANFEKILHVWKDE